MSEENLELARAAYFALVGDQWDVAANLLAPEVELHGTVGGLDEGTVARGVEEVRQRFQQEEPEAWDQIRYRPEKFISAQDRVVVLQRESRRGRGSGVEVENHTAAIFELRDGRVVRIQGFMDQGEALEAVGLSE